MELAPAASVRRYLSESGEKELLRILHEQQQRHKHVTSDDVRLAARAVASQGGSVAIPPDFPPSRWVLEFKRVHGFVQFNSFAFGAAAPFRLPERLELPQLRAVVSAAPASQRATHSNSDNASNDKRSSSAGAGAALANGSNQSSGNSSNEEMERSPSEENRKSSSETRKSSSETRREAMDDPTSSPSSAGHLPTYDNEKQRAVQLQRGFSQRHRQLLQQQQQRRAMLVEGCRRATTAWPERDQAAADHDHEEMRSDSSRGSLDSENGATTGPSNSPRDIDGGDVRPSMNTTPPHSRHTVSTTSNNADDTQDSASNASSSTDKRSYKLSHTVPTETWEKAIAAVEQQGMSLRAAAKLYGVHFAALHRRVKKRVQDGQSSKGSNGYFHPSDEAGIMRVVVARAELGVLMTFDELMRLVEASALRKLPDISVDSARKLLTRFQSRNENSIRHIIVDWPPPRPTAAGEGASQQHQPYLEHPGFAFGPKPPVILRSMSAGTSKPATAGAMAAATKKSLFVPPSRLGAPPSRLNSLSDELRRPGLQTMNANGGPVEKNGSLPRDRLHFVGSRSRSEGDNDALMVV
ncbi:hypothetical protein PR003_g19380 [Phytophthora rubi]|uniref:HTH psq-type domain-containing protein n=1 Tax=Phytophthora rubi TaxID=129364 RepID=A0A6A4DW69_9STRA|nr:hypothetical protein PR002_g19476 [Phytophthora rubi]KAE9313917.1 hypothetical protein PR003_g19380 [Phytophthora rubi]